MRRTERFTRISIAPDGVVDIERADRKLYLLPGRECRLINNTTMASYSTPGFMPAWKKATLPEVQTGEVK